MVNYFVAECKGCLATQGGTSTLDRDNATLNCKQCGRSSKLKIIDRPDGAYVWYFGSNIHTAQNTLRTLKLQRKK
jgi:hypothetical protein